MAPLDATGEVYDWMHPCCLFSPRSNRAVCSHSNLWLHTTYMHAALLLLVLFPHILTTTTQTCGYKTSPYTTDSHVMHLCSVSYCFYVESALIDFPPRNVLRKWTGNKKVMTKVHNKIKIKSPQNWTIVVRSCNSF